MIKINGLLRDVLLISILIIIYIVMIEQTLHSNPINIYHIMWIVDVKYFSNALL